MSEQKKVYEQFVQQLRDVAERASQPRLTPASLAEREEEIALLRQAANLIEFLITSEGTP